MATLLVTPLISTHEPSSRVNGLHSANLLQCGILSQAAVIPEPRKPEKVANLIGACVLWDFFGGDFTGPCLSISVFETVRLGC